MKLKFLRAPPLSALLLIFLANHCGCGPVPDLTTVIKISDQNPNSTYLTEILRLSKAAEIKQYLNEKIDPCDNFYEFACGNWAKINPADSLERVETGLFTMLSKAMERKIALILFEGPTENDTVVDRKIKKFYEACVNVRDFQESYKEKLVNIVSEFGQMPVLSGDDWNETNFDWIETVARISHTYDEGTILEVGIMQDFKNSSVNRLYIGSPDFPLETRSMYVDNATALYRGAYVDGIKQKLILYLGLDEELADTTAAELLYFEVALAQGLSDEKQGISLEKNAIPTTVEEMHNKYQPTINVKKLVNITLGYEVNETIYEFQENYQQNLKTVIETTPKRIIANYIYFTLLSAFMVKSEQTREKQQQLCIGKTKKYFSKNLDNMIYRKYKTEESERNLRFIWQELVQSFNALMRSDKVQWINETTRKYAIEKLAAMKFDINSYAEDDFAAELKHLNITNDDYVANMKSLLRLRSQRAIDSLYQPPKLEGIEIFSYSPVNLILENSIKIPVALLQPYYFHDSSYPNAIKFGSLGSLIGHELIHGFDDEGRKFNKDGQYHIWWDEYSQRAFEQRTQCFTKQYSRYIYNGRYLPISNSQSENIADNGGLRLSFAAYLDWYESAARAGEDLQKERLPKLNYTSKQLFFISFAQAWCNDVHPAMRELQTSTDTHVPGKFRVIGSLSNLDEFSKEFNCAVGTSMNPQKKCQIY